ncbi:MAG: permease [Nitrospinae bacterium]|nr:permease [Nitrospinota bacterium]
MLYTLFIAGITALRDYVATHVLTCLVPAFFLAGAMVTFINRQSVLMHLGGQASKPKSFTLASLASFFIAACSCTVIPVSSGLYYAGAGIGVAFIILWVAPASNILALVYTGNILGSELLIARVVAALFMAYVVGYVMSWVFCNEGPPPTTAMPQGDMEKAIGREEIILILLLALTLLLPNYLVTEGPYIYKVGVWGIGSSITAAYAIGSQNNDRLIEWMRETWWFVKTIFPLLLGGVFLVGVLGEVLPEELIKEYLGGNSIASSFAATLLGSVTYFATMTEAPFVDKLMQMGMGKGPALALLLTGPGLSLPNWLAIARVFGFKKALVYVPLIIALGTLVGWFFGNFIF